MFGCFLNLFFNCFLKGYSCLFCLFVCFCFCFVVIFLWSLFLFFNLSCIKFSTVFFSVLAVVSLLLFILFIFIFYFLLSLFVECFSFLFFLSLFFLFSFFFFSFLGWFQFLYFVLFLFFSAFGGCCFSLGADWFFSSLPGSLADAPHTESANKNDIVKTFTYTSIPIHPCTLITQTKSKTLNSLNMWPSFCSTLPVQCGGGRLSGSLVGTPRGCSTSEAF